MAIVAAFVTGTLVSGGIALADGDAITKLTKECSKDPKKDGKIKAHCELLNLVGGLQTQIDDIEPSSGDTVIEVNVDPTPITINAPQGEKGDKGDTGAKGETGSQGPTGEGTGDVTQAQLDTEIDARTLEDLRLDEQRRRGDSALDVTIQRLDITLDTEIDDRTRADNILGELSRKGDSTLDRAIQILDLRIQALEAASP